MNHSTRLLALVLALASVCLCASGFAAVRPTVESDVAARFPILADTFGPDRERVAAAVTGRHDSINLAAGAAHVSLRPATNDRTFESARRFSGRGTEGILLESAAARRSISFEVADSAGITAIAADGRSVRFVSNGSGRDLVLAAPLVIGSDQRPSFGAHWSVERAGSGSTFIRLEITDRAVQYPAVAVWSTGAARVRVKANALELGTGSISGQLLTSASVPVADALFLLYDNAGEYLDYGYSDAAGNYSFTGLSTGAYRILLIADGYSYQLYDGIPCPDGECSIAAGTPINVVDTANTPGINFTVTNSRTLLSGTVADLAGNPLGDVSVVIYESDGTPHAAVTSHPVTGFYKSDLRAAGSYYARTFNSVHAGAIDQVYSGIDCTTCDVLAGTPISVSAGQERSGVNFALRTDGGRIAGQVTDELDDAPLTSRVVTIYNDDGNPVSYGVTGSDGTYISFNGLTAGEYYLGVETAGYTSELYDDVQCTRCSPTAGTGVVVTAGSTVLGVDFVLSQMKTFIRGTVRGAGTLEPLESVLVSAYDEAGQHVQAATTDASGAYTLTVPDPGDYYVRTDSRGYAGLVDQLYQNIDCSGCAVTGGTKVGTEPGQPAVGVDFTLDRDGGSFSGRLTNASLGGVAFGFVAVYSATGEEASHGYSDASGNYTLVRGLTAGNYYAIAYAEGFEPMIYGGGFCQAGCDPTTGTPIAVTRGANTAGIDFVLGTTAAHITGNVIAADTGNPLANVAVVIYNTAGAIVTSIDTSATGSYDAFLPGAGTYFARTHNTENPGYADQLYNSFECINCDPTTGTPILVGAGETTPGIDFALPVGCSPIDVGPAGVPNTAVGSSYSTTFTASGATGAVTFEATEGTVPPGLSLNATTGVLSGTPTAAATYVFVIKATDARGCSGEREYTIVVALTATQTTLSSSPAAPVYGNTVTMTATVAPATATGTVAFHNGATDLGSVPVSGGTASVVLSGLSAGTYVITAVYSGDDTHGPSTAAPFTLVVAKATPQITWATPAAIIYGTALSATQLNATANVAGSFTYSPAAGTVLNAGSHTLTATFTPTDSGNYATATASVTLTVNKATPSFSNLTSSTIIIGTATTTLGGTIAAGALIPPGSVAITMNGVTQNVTIQADGTFSATFNTAALTPQTAGYPVTYAYAGNANFNSANGSSLLTVTYGFSGGPISNGTDPVSFRVHLLNAAGVNVSSSSIVVTAYGVRLVGASAWSPLSSTGNQGLDLKFQNAEDGSYKFNLAKGNRPPGTYELGFIAANDPVIHIVTFVIQ